MKKALVLLSLISVSSFATSHKALIDVTSTDKVLVVERAGNVLKKSISEVSLNDMVMLRKDCMDWTGSDFRTVACLEKTILKNVKSSDLIVID